MRRISSTEVRLFSQLHYFMPAGALIHGTETNPFYRDGWKMARAESFDPIKA